MERNISIGNEKDDIRITFFGFDSDLGTFLELVMINSGNRTREECGFFFTYVGDSKLVHILRKKFYNTLADFTVPLQQIKVITELFKGYARF